MVKIIVDCFGGDHSPQANIEGALNAIEKNPDIHLILTGDENAIWECLDGKSYDPSRLEVVSFPF